MCVCVYVCDAVSCKACLSGLYSRILKALVLILHKKLVSAIIKEGLWSSGAQD